MGRRIDLGDDDSQDSLADAMRQLEQDLAGQQKPAEAKPEEPVEAGLPEEGEEEAGPSDQDSAAKREFEAAREAEHRKSREGIQDALEQIDRDQRETVDRGVRRKAPSPIKWVVTVVLLIGLIGAAVLTLRPEPLPPPAASPQDAVRGFWAALVEENYEAATVHYPALVDRYGSRKQAALHLRDMFGGNPPIQVSSVGEPEALPESDDLRLSYEVFLRNGRPRTGEFIVRRAASPEPVYFIVTAP